MSACLAILVFWPFLRSLPLNVVIEGHISLTFTDHVEYKQVWDWTMLKPCPFHTLFTLCKLKTSVSFKKASWHTIPIWPNTHLFLSLTLFRPKYLYNSYYCFFTLLEALTLFFLYCNLIPNDFAGSKYFLTMGWKYFWRSFLIFQKNDIEFFILEVLFET